MPDMPLMSCGHVATTIDTTTLEPTCPSCWEIGESNPIPVTAPDLTGRVSQCIYCKKEKMSSLDLPFFEYQGEGSYSSTVCKHDGYAKVAHRDGRYASFNGNRGKLIPTMCLNRGLAYEPRGDIGYDNHYDGCRGWD